jgi:signal transduction histidine kinase
MARIVLLDDEARLLLTLARFLENQGHQVTRGERFADLEHVLWPGRFEVLITDIVMPDLDGMKVLAEVVQKRQCQEPVILITGEPNLETASEAVRRGAFDYISKPVTKDKLLESVARGLRHVQLLRERDQARHAELQILKNLALIGESASVLSHEVRTPITSLRQALRAVGDKLGVGDNVLITELLDNLARIERMLGQTLSFAKPLQLHVQATEPKAFLDDCLRQVRDLPVMKGLEVRIGCAQGLGSIDVDPHLLAEVITNLLRNSAEACSGKGQIEVRATAKDKNLLIEVSDDGPGVPPELRGEIFKPFRSWKSNGTGIGLAFCRKVVESHGGSIDLADRPGPGACFRVELPRHGQTSSSSETTHA